MIKLMMKPLKKEKRVPGCTKRKSFRSSLFQLGVRIKKRLKIRFIKVDADSRQ